MGRLRPFTLNCRFHGLDLAPELRSNSEIFLQCLAGLYQEVASSLGEVITTLGSLPNSTNRQLTTLPSMLMIE